MSNTDPMQQVIAPLEHREFARNFTRENPVIGPLALSTAIPAYTVAKSMGLTDSRTPATMDQVFAGYEGMVQGMRERIKGGRQ